MSLIGTFDVDYYLVHLCELKTIITLTRTNKYFYELIKNAPFYKNLMKLKKEDKKLEIFELGYLNIIKILYNDTNYQYPNDTIVLVCKNGHVNILEWFKNSGFEFRYTSDAIDSATKNDHINVLDWFKNSGLEFRYTNHTINWASGNGHIHILNWFKNNNYK